MCLCMELKPLSPACTDAIVFLSQISSIDLLSPLCLSTPRSLCFSFSISYLIQLTPRSPAGPWNGLLPFPSSFSLSASLSWRLDVVFVPTDVNTGWHRCTQSLLLLTGHACLWLCRFTDECKHL